LIDSSNSVWSAAFSQLAAGALDPKSGWAFNEDSRNWSNIANQAVSALTSSSSMALFVPPAVEGGQSATAYVSIGGGGGSPGPSRMRKARAWRGKPKHAPGQTLSDNQYSRWTRDWIGVTADANGQIIVSSGVVARAPAARPTLTTPQRIRRWCVGRCDRRRCDPCRTSLAAAARRRGILRALNDDADRQVAQNEPDKLRKTPGKCGSCRIIAVCRFARLEIGRCGLGAGLPPSLGAVALHETIFGAPHLPSTRLFTPT